MRERNLKNLRTEDTGLLYLQEKIKGFCRLQDIKDTETKKIIYERDISKEGRKLLFDIAGIDHKKYWKSVDGVILNVKNLNEVKTIDDYEFIEVKTTASPTIKKLPYGVWFGFTQNEEEFAKNVKNYKLCFVHTVFKKHCFITYDEYEELIEIKRIQYQINFKEMP